MRDLAAKPEPGPIEIACVAESDPKERARIKADAISQAHDALPTNEKGGFEQDGITVEIILPPEPVLDKGGSVVGLRVEARAQDANGPLPQGDGIHIVINPPVKVPDGTVRIEKGPSRPSNDIERDASPPDIEVSNFVEDPVAALRAWLVDSIKHDALAHGWKPT